MSRRTNLINTIISMAITVGLVFFAAFFGNTKSNGDYSLGVVICFFAVGAIISGFLNTLFHELSHIISGKKNGFAFISVCVWFFKWKKVKDKVKFEFTLIYDAGGYTEMVSKSTDNLALRFKKMTRAGLVANFVLMLLGVIPFCIPVLPVPVVCIFGMFLPISAYCFFTNGLPVSNYGARNDGAVLYGLRKNDDESKVMLSLLSIQSELYSGKTPSQIEESFYFDVPQLQEDSLNFVMLLNARYNYYLDKEDYENAKKVTERLLSLEDFLPKPIYNAVLTDALYATCTYDYDQNKADEYMYELEKYLNKDNSVSNVRAKLAYIVCVKGETEGIDMFYKKALRESKRCPIKGIGEFERKLIEKIRK